MDGWYGISQVFFRGGGVGNFPCESSLMAKAELVWAALLACIDMGLVDMINGKIQPNVAIEALLLDIQYVK
ncbi:hypothetical protein DVH24_030836 [Malus domestica]|uniref:Uncharacterized protein n=1 Tax=Malus domestica TaxID=3750 RepID=A0A498HHW6_MALDO|nr:hypothetical protein DVH24_030836 [Malus domestica]